MNKKHLIWSLAALAIAGCSNNETVDINRGDAIAFRTVAENMTRSTVESTNTLSAFKVSGFTEGKTLMSGVEVTKKDGKWTYANTQFWPESSVDFYSVAPVGTNVNITAESQKIENFTVDTDVAKQVDLLYAVNKDETKEDHAASAVNINFRHALSQIVFKAKNTNENLKVIVKGVKIGNIKKSGDFTYPTSSTTPQNIAEDGTIVATTQGTWGNVNTAETFSAGMNAGGVTLDGKVETAVDLTAATGSDASKSYTGALFMIPQPLAAWDPSTTGALSSSNTGVYFLLDCQIFSGTNRDVQIWPAGTASTSAEIAVPANSLTWEQGKKYVYTFIFGDGAGYIPGPDPDPDPTLIGIDFDVTVDEFINGGEEDIEMETGKE